MLTVFAKAQRWGTRFVDVYIQASDVNGLNHGEDIRIAGIVAGQVGTMHLNDQGEVKVKLKIEANKLDKWTKERHDYYPTTDILLESIGLDKTYSKVLKEFVYPCAIHKWQLHGKPWPDLSSENFMIKYQEDVQGHLSLHHDSGLISCVLTLNRDFEGGGTWFWRQQKVHKGNSEWN